MLNFKHLAVVLAAIMALTMGTAAAADSPARPLLSVDG